VKRLSSSKIYICCLFCKSQEVNRSARLLVKMAVMRFQGKKRNKRNKKRLPLLRSNKSGLSYSANKICSNFIMVCRGQGIAAVAYLRHNARRRWMGKGDTESLNALPQRLASLLLGQLRRRWGLLVLGHGVTHHHIVNGLIMLSLRVASLSLRPRRNASAWRPCLTASAPRRLARRPPPGPHTPTERSLVPCPLIGWPLKKTITRR